MTQKLNSNKNDNFNISLEIDDFPPNAYSTLGLNPMEAIKDSEIKSKYRKLAFKYHPDLIASQIEESDDKEKKLELMRIKFEEINEAYKLLTNTEERAKLDTRLKVHIEKKKALLKMNKERREMKEELEKREKKKRKMNEELDFWSRKLAKAKQIVESGGYDELETIQLEYFREEKAKFLRNRSS